jgi:Spy/CpxP family protein refolding chaperone
MKYYISICLLLTAFFTSVSFSEEDYTSKYKGEEHREIKSLSNDDIEELIDGKGWGLAKAAELNGYPGPIHILQMADKINLTKEQKVKVNELFQQMRNKAIPLGIQLIQLEKQLNITFQNKTINKKSLDNQLSYIENVRKKLRFVHLYTHLETPKILTKEQIDLYNKLRGYDIDPCINIPVGHDVKMWKKHNGCK